MKTPVAITLVIMGGLLVAFPILSDYLHRAQTVEALNAIESGSISLQSTLSTEYRFGCWLLGAGMIGAAIFASRRDCTGVSQHGSDQG